MKIHRWVILFWAIVFLDVKEPTHFSNEIEVLHIESIDTPQKQHRAPTVDTTLLARYIGNEKSYGNSWYSFLLLESQYQEEHYTLSGGLAYQKRKEQKSLFLNSFEWKYFGDTYRIKLGKSVQKAGVLDYFSLLDTLNPSRPEFFYDSQLTIKKIPLWMGSLEYEMSDEMHLTLLAQPFDPRYASYKGAYVDYALQQFIPEYFRDTFSQAPLGTEIYAPVYYDTLVPYLNDEIEAKSDGSKLRFNRLSFGCISEYNDADKKLGALYFQRYSEVPLVEVDQNLYDAIMRYRQGKDFSRKLTDYLTSNDYDLIKSVEEFRYRQFGLYGETSYGSYGFRAALGYRDKLPILNRYTPLLSVGFGVDKLSSTLYTAFETQYLYLTRLQKHAFVSILHTRFDRTIFSYFSGYFENSIIVAGTGEEREYSFTPRYVINYGSADLSLEGVFFMHNSKRNTLSLMFRWQF